MTGQDLKNSILQLAIQGKLVPQDSHDEPASKLLERIKAEKERLVRARSIKKEKPLAPITDDEKPFEIPESWEWCRLNHVIGYETNLVSPEEYQNYNHIAPDNIQKGTGKLLEFRTVKEDKVQSNNHLFFKGQIIYSKIRPLLRKAIIAPFDGLCSADMYPLKSYINTNFVLQILLSDFLNIQIADICSSRVKMPKINQEEMSKLLIPLPPLSEQQRIVTKIEELMPLVEEYGKAQSELDSINRSLPERLKQSILQEAIMGKLGTNNPDDEPASELLERIRKEKEKLIKEKKIKKEKTLPEITDEEKPFEIPENWVWCRLGHLVNMRIGKTPARGDMKFWSEPIFSWVSISDMTEYGHVKSTKEKVSKYAADNAFGSISEPGSLIMSFKLTVGRTCILDIAAYHNEAIITIDTYCDNDKYLRDYLFKMLPLLTNYGDSKEAIKGKTLNSDSLSNLIIPLPPLAEQHRIVEKLDALLPQISELNKQ